MCMLKGRTISVLYVKQMFEIQVKQTFKVKTIHHFNFHVIISVKIKNENTR